MTYRPLIAHSPQEDRLYRLQAEWRIADERVRQTIAAEIARHPEWAIAVTADGLRLAIATQQPQFSNLSRIAALREGNTCPTENNRLVGSN